MPNHEDSEHKEAVNNTFFHLIALNTHLLFCAASLSRLFLFSQLF